MNISNNEGILDNSRKLVCMEMCDKKMSTEITNDYSLPDYMPEIRRVLHVEAVVLPPAKYINVTGAEFNGNIDYNVLYVGADGELHSTPLSAEYNLTMPIDTEGFDFSENITSCFNSSVESVNIRLSGPRKLNIRCRLNTNVRLYGMMNIGVDLDKNNTLSVETLKCQTQAARVMCAVSEPFDITDETIVPCDNFQVITANGSVFIESVTNRPDEVIVSGTVNLKMLYTDVDNGNIEKVVKRIPFSTEVELEGISEASVTKAKGYITNTAVTVEDGRIISEMSLLLDVEAQNSDPITYIRDVYSTEYNDKCSCRDYSIPQLGYCKNTNFSMNEKISLESLSIGDDFNIIDCYGIVNVDSTEAINDKIEVLGSVKYTLLTKNSDEFSSVDIVLPVKYDFNTDNTNISVFDTNMNIITCKARKDDISVSIEAEIAVISTGISKEEILVVDAVTFEDKIVKDKACITVCYKGLGEDIWSVAKRYHVSVSHIETINGSNEGSINKGYVII